MELCEKTFDIFAHFRSESNTIAVLYATEAEGRVLTPEERQRLRAASTFDLARLVTTNPTAYRVQYSHLPSIDYSLKRWPALTRYAETGDLPIENSIRPIAQGKKNWLFAGSESAWQRAAVMQTLPCTAKLNGLSPATWLKDMLEKLPIWPNSRIDELLPLRFAD